ncbi:MAG: hypothetical protein H7175_17925 [Burkholderiales bacterium]|nr:hypothetical protein [Anaerolineae bacterium]
MEHWLHQHIFKVGWLLTKDYQTTTILYYIFFLPGVILHEVSYWLVAGILNVRADRAIAWPDKQEIGELKLNFVRLGKKANRFKVAVITTAPLIIGLALVWYIAINVLNIQDFLNRATGEQGDLGTAISELTSAPDFWLWIYLAFTISNTMMPNLSELRGWRSVGVIIGILVAILFIVGVGDRVLGALSIPIADALNLLSAVFAVIIGINLFGLAMLGTIEAVIERVTGDSATFKDGKMITMRREEILKMRERERQSARQAARGQQREQRRTALAGPPSIYKLELPIPGAPGKEIVTPFKAPALVPTAIVQPKPALPSVAATSPIAPATPRPELAGPSTVTVRTPLGTTSVERNPGADSAKPTTSTGEMARAGTPTPSGARPGQLSGTQPARPATSTGEMARAGTPAASNPGAPGSSTNRPAPFTSAGPGSNQPPRPGGPAGSSPTSPNVPGGNQPPRPGAGSFGAPSSPGSNQPPRPGTGSLGSPNTSGADRPATPAGTSRPSPLSPGGQPARPAAGSPFGAPRREPAPADDEDDEEEEPRLSASTARRVDPFASLSSRPTSTFGALPTRSDSEDEDEDDNGEDDAYDDYVDDEAQYGDDEDNP